MIRPNGTISADQARLLLQRFRDLNLGPTGIEVSERGRVLVRGCLSLDHPVENGVRYALSSEQGERVLRIRWQDERLVLQLATPDLAQPENAPCTGEFDVALSCDGLGRVAAPEIGARLRLEDSDARGIEHFLRRIVRTVYAQAG